MDVSQRLLLGFRARAALASVVSTVGPAGGVCACGVVLHHHLSSLKRETSRCDHLYFEKAVSPSEAVDAIRATWLWESFSSACSALLWRCLPATAYGVTPEAEVV